MTSRTIVAALFALLGMHAAQAQPVPARIAGVYVYAINSICQAILNVQKNAQGAVTAIAPLATGNFIHIENGTLAFNLDGTVRMVRSPAQGSLVRVRNPNGSLSGQPLRASTQSLTIKYELGSNVFKLQNVGEYRAWFSNFQNGVPWRVDFALLEESCLRQGYAVRK